MAQHGWPPFTNCETRPPGQIHGEPISTIKFSNELEMPKAAALRLLPCIPDLHLRADNPRDMERLEAACTPHNFVFATQARREGAQRNVYDGMLLGTDKDGYDIWASLVPCGRNNTQYACDGPHRALVLIQVIQDQRTEQGGGSVVAKGLGSMDLVEHWHQGIPGENLVDRFCYIYDALVEEAGAD